MEYQRILVLYTGGTIGMVDSPQGLRPDIAIINHALKPFENKYHFDWHVCDPLIDSSAVTLVNWQQWLDVLAEKLANYDACLILHGTDTLAYSASMLSCFIQGLNKPIILTGSQFPYTADNSDAPQNLNLAVAALELKLNGVFLAFYNKLFEASSCTKISTADLDAFCTPFADPVAIYQQQNWTLLNPPVTDSQPVAFYRLNPELKILPVYLLPGFTDDLLSQLLTNNHYDAVILMSFGHGNFPLYPKMEASLVQYINQGGLVLNISQVLAGEACQKYAASYHFAQIGLIQAGKITLEMAYAKLLYGLSQHLNHGEIVNSFQEK